MNEKHDGTRMIHGECHLEATSPWADEVLLNGLRLHLDLHIVPRGSRVVGGHRASTALRRAGASVAALCFGSGLHQRRRALVALMGAIALALAFWMRAPASSHAPSSDRAAPPVAAKLPEPPALPSPAVQLAPPVSVAPVLRELIPPPAVSPAPELAPTPSPRPPAPPEETSARRTFAAAEPAPPPRINTRAQAVKSFVSPPAADRVSVAALPTVPVRQRPDMLDLFGDTK